MFANRLGIYIYIYILEFESRSLLSCCCPLPFGALAMRWHSHNECLLVCSFVRSFVLIVIHLNLVLSIIYYMRRMCAQIGNLVSIQFYNTLSLSLCLSYISSFSHHRSVPYTIAGAVDLSEVLFQDLLFETTCSKRHALSIHLARLTVMVNSDIVHYLFS